MEARVKELREQCERWKERTGDFEKLNSRADHYLAEMVELHALQKVHQQLELEIWRTRKVITRVISLPQDS